MFSFPALAAEGNPCFVPQLCPGAGSHGAVRGEVGAVAEPLQDGSVRDPPGPRDGVWQRAARGRGEALLHLLQRGAEPRAQVRHQRPPQVQNAHQEEGGVRGAERQEEAKDSDCLPAVQQHCPDREKQRDPGLCENVPGSQYPSGEG